VKRRVRCRSVTLTKLLLLPTAAAALCAVVAAAPAPALAETETATAGAVTATFTYTKVAETEYTGLKVSISRAGAPPIEIAPAVPNCEEPYCWPGGVGERPSIAASDLDGDGEPEVLLDLYTGGAHCCLELDLLTWDGTAYRQIVHDFADPGYQLKDLDGDGQPELVSADAAFGYAFTSFAFSYFPLQIWHYAAGAFSDVTAKYPNLVRADAARAWKGYRSQLRRPRESEPRGAIAAWAADRYRLGHRASTLRLLRRLARRGRLPGAPPKRQAKFVTDLDRFLRRLGYGR
jgi:hypothetical protein